MKNGPEGPCFLLSLARASFPSWPESRIKLGNVRFDFLGYHQKYHHVQPAIFSALSEWLYGRHSQCDFRHASNMQRGYGAPIRCLLLVPGCTRVGTWLRGESSKSTACKLEHSQQALPLCIGVRKPPLCIDHRSRGAKTVERGGLCFFLPPMTGRGGFGCAWPVADAATACWSSPFHRTEGGTSARVMAADHLDLTREDLSLSGVLLTANRCTGVHPIPSGNPNPIFLLVPHNKTLVRIRCLT